MENRRKTIVIEAQRIFRSNKHGMDFVVLELIRKLQKIDTYNQYIIAVSPGEDYCVQESENFKIEILNSNNYLWWEQVLLPRLVKKYNADLLHCTSNTAPYFCDIPLVLTLHDIIFLEKKIGKNRSWYQQMGRIYRRFFVPIILKKAKYIITVSKFEKANIEAFFPRYSNKIKTIYNGVSAYFRPIDAQEEITLPIRKRNFWLFFGNTDPKKNMVNTLLAYALYWKQSVQKKKLVILDQSPEFINSLLRELKINFVYDDILVLSYVAHDKLIHWYGQAFGFLYTSLRESFGLPLLESMSCKTPVVGANISAIPEIAQNSIVYVDPNDSVSIAEGMLLLEANTSLYEQCIESGLEIVKHYSWEHTARETLDLYTSILQEN